MPKPLAPELREAILTSIRNGAGERSMGSIAREHNVARSTVHRLAAANGLGNAWDRSKTAHATRAAEMDAKAIRAMLARAHLSDAAKIRQRLFEPTQVVAPSGKIVTLAQPPARDVRDFMQSVASALKVSLDVDKHDMVDTGVSAARGLVGGLMDAIEDHASPTPNFGFDTVGEDGDGADGAD